MTTVSKKGRPKPPLAITDEERETLQRYDRGRTVSQALALRARIVLRATSGIDNGQIAEELGITRQTVGVWRTRFLRYRIDGLTDLPRPNVHRKLSDERVEEIIKTTLGSSPRGATHWSTRKMAKAAGVSQSSVSRVWRAFQLKPHRVRTFTLSTDDFFVEKVRDIVGLYLAPPDHAVVLCLDEKSQVQALERKQPMLPFSFGVPQRRTATYKRHGVTNLFAALEVATGRVIGECYPRKRAVEFRRFLQRIDAEVPEQFYVELVVDNSSIHGAPEVRRWLRKHPRFRMHFTPTYSSWINMVERWFAKLTDETLRRGSHCSTEQLKTAIEQHIAATNAEPKPFIWTKTADDIIASVARFCSRTLDQHS